MLAVDFAFIAAIAAIYLFDCVVLVQRGQAVLARWGGRWRVSTGTRHYLISGRPIVFLNPLTPGVATLKSRPLLEPPPPGALRPAAVVRALRGLPTLAALQWTLVLVLVPVAVVRFPGWPLLAVLILAYCNAVAMVLVLLRRCRRLGVPRRALGSIAFNALVCLPFSINLPRRAGLALPVAGGADRYLRLVPSVARSGARSALVGQLEEALQDTDEDTPRFAELTVLRGALAKPRPS
ncbi:MAG TPA: hypothetical protein VML91_00685 [Burkholderiales bacterium]|nr:hypothetical protein [Burkholderiales bacterium]